METYLSDAWIAALNDALVARGDLKALAPLVIEQVVRDVPGRGVVRYRLEIDEQGARVVAAPDAETGGTRADLRLTTDYRTAVAIVCGQENAESALAEGRLRLGGDIEVLARQAEALGALGDATAQLRAVTTYVSP